MARLKEHYEEIVRPALMKDFGYENIHMVPKLEKIVVNMGLGRILREKKILEGASNDLSSITGQKPLVTLAKKSIAGFKLRENMPVGLKVTLRKNIMYEFLDRLVNIAMPRIRDFNGLSPKSFDGRGNFAMGIKEHYVFPEIRYDYVEDVLGMDICIVTSAKTPAESKGLLEKFNFPFHS